jgi:tRNA nucleotidyltransferase/poly(A) polymerase
MSAATVHHVKVPTDLLAHPIYQAACAMADTLTSQGHQALFVGGFVRDLVRRSRDGAGPWPMRFDIDVATSADPAEIRAVFRTAHFVGQLFGVSMVDHGPYCFELATFRSEGRYSDGRRPDSVTKGTLEDDAARRDFSVNALYFDPANSVILDFHGGVSDIAAEVLRTVGDPKRRFEEDHLRIIRLCRFAALLDFEVVQETWQAALEMAHSVTRLSRERILMEIKKTPPSGVPRFLLLLHKLGVDNLLWDLSFDPHPVWLKEPEVRAELEGLLAAEAHHPMAFVVLASWRCLVSLSQHKRDALESALKQWPAAVADRRLLQGLGQLLRLLSVDETRELHASLGSLQPPRAAVVWLTCAVGVLEKLAPLREGGLRVLCDVACESCAPKLQSLLALAVQTAVVPASGQARKDIVTAVHGGGLDPRWIGVLETWGRLRIGLETSGIGLEGLNDEIHRLHEAVLKTPGAQDALLKDVRVLSERLRGPSA